MSLRESAEKAARRKDWIDLRATIDCVSDYNEGESVLFAVLEQEFTEGYGEDRKVLGPNETPQELIDLALEKFSATDGVRRHGSWTHALSHFTKLLWKRGLMGWVACLNNQAFGNAEKGWEGDRAYSCCDRLVQDVVRYGRYDMNPLELGLTPERIRQVASEYSVDVTTRILAMPFASQEAADVWEAQWCLADPAKRCRKWDQEAQENLASGLVAQKHIEVLRQAGHDVSQYEQVALKLCGDEIVRLETKLQAAQQDWQRERAEAGLKIVQEELAKLTSGEISRLLA